MVNTRWTNEQLQAITEKDCNLLVAAAAGAGKTAVLVERIIRKITNKDPIDIDKLLVVTFTNAAATEMRQRIADAITAVLEEQPENQMIRRQLTLLNKASITTIHSFCLEVIRRHFQTIGIDPGFRIADETEATLMKIESVQELFEDLYEEESTNPVFMDLLECYGGNRDDQALQDMVLRVYSFIQSSPWPEKWLKQKTKMFSEYEGVDFGQSPWGKVMLQSFAVEMQGLYDSMIAAVKMLGPESGLEKYQEVFYEDIANLQALIQICSSERANKWDFLWKFLQNIQFRTLPRAGKDADKDIQDYAKKVREDVKKCLRDLCTKVFTADSAGISEDLKGIQPLIQCLSDLVLDFSQRYADKKSRKSLVDFNDLEHFCLKILIDDQSQIPSKAALAYRDKFTEILVDEYQDSNDVQETIIRMISRESKDMPNVFMVGDVKQSIYRFRQAKPELFLEKYNRYSSNMGEAYRKILLYKNFRSRKEVVDAANYIFKQIMTVNVGELDYTDDEALNPGASFPENLDPQALVGGEVEFHLIQTANSNSSQTWDEAKTEEINDSTEDPMEEIQETQDEENPPDPEMLDSIQCEARLIAKRIRELVSPNDQNKYFAVFDKTTNGYRQVEFRDIVILLRTTRNWAEVFKEELISQGIPTFADTGTGFFKTFEVQVMLSLLQIIDNPLQDIPLLAVMRSPIVGFTTDELAELRLVNRKASLYEALESLAKTFPETSKSMAAEKASLFVRNLHRWRELSFYLSTDQLLWKLYTETGYYSMIGAMPAGEQRQANLRILFERARQFEETSLRGLFSFITFVDRLKSSNNDLGSAKILGENNQVVRIMSIHKSKGLEFPVVILAGCGKKFNLQDMNKSILMHQELGFGPDIVDHKLRLSYPSVPKQAIREKTKIETLSEEMRILYVALTRAREKLIITGAVSNVEKNLVKWARCATGGETKLPAYQMVRSNCYLDWIGPGLMRHSSCSALREYSSTASWGELLEDDSTWLIHIWDKKDIVSVSSDKIEQNENPFLTWLDQADKQVVEDDTEPVMREINRRLGWEYPYRQVATIPAKISVTELKRRFEISEDDMNVKPIRMRKPMFLEDKKGLNAAEMGTIMHFVMQHLDFHKTDIDKQIQEMINHDLLTEIQAHSVKPQSIQSYLDSILGRRMLNSDNVQREVPFNLELPCEEIYPDLIGHCQGETVLLQGVIDCFFEEPDGLVLIDYKTDQVPETGLESIKDRYSVQISYYTKALERLTGKKVKEKYIYLFSSGDILQY